MRNTIVPCIAFCCTWNAFLPRRCYSRRRLSCHSHLFFAASAIVQPRTPTIFEFSHTNCPLLNKQTQEHGKGCRVEKMFLVLMSEWICYIHCQWLPITFVFMLLSMNQAIWLYPSSIPFSYIASAITSKSQCQSTPLLSDNFHLPRPLFLIQMKSAKSISIRRSYILFTSVSPLLQIPTQKLTSSLNRPSSHTSLSTSNGPSIASNSSSGHDGGSNDSSQCKPGSRVAGGGGGHTTGLAKTE